MKSATLSLLLLLGTSAPVFSQNGVSYEGVTPGTRVRVSAPAVLPDPVIGTFLSTSRDSLLVSPGEHAVVRLDLSTVEALDISAGRDRMKWALTGSAAGMLGVILLSPAVCDPGDMGCGLGMIAASVLVGIPGGALAGALSAPERWVRYSGWRETRTEGTPQVTPASAPIEPASALLMPGTSVRLSLAERPRERLEGRVTEMSRDTISVWHRDAGAMVTYPVARLGSLEVRGGDDRRRGARKGAMIGSAVGLGLGILTAGGDDWEEGAGTASDRIGVAVTTGLMGALIGSAFGYAFPPTGWTKLPLLPSTGQR